MTGSVNGHGRDEMERAQPAGQLKRRGLIAAAAALVAGALAKASERLAQAADGGNFILGQNNSTASETKITRNLGTTAGLVAFGVNNTANGGTGIDSSTSGAGFAGVLGVNGSPASVPTGSGGIGVAGVNFNVTPTANGIGVLGQVLAPSSVGVRGISFANSPSAVAVQGLSNFDGSGPGIGVHGRSAGIGVEGDSTNS